MASKEVYKLEGVISKKEKLQKIHKQAGMQISNTK